MPQKIWERVWSGAHDGARTFSGARGAKAGKSRHVPGGPQPKGAGVHAGSKHNHLLRATVHGLVVVGSAKACWSHRERPNIQQLVQRRTELRGLRGRARHLHDGVVQEARANGDAGRHLGPARACSADRLRPSKGLGQRIAEAVVKSQKRSATSQQTGSQTRSRGRALTARPSSRTRELGMQQCCAR